MANANSPKTEKSRKRSELNEQFYSLLKELVETQSIILEKVVNIEKGLASEGKCAKDPLEAWKNMG